MMTLNTLVLSTLHASDIHFTWNVTQTERKQVYVYERNGR